MVFSKDGAFVWRGLPLLLIWSPIPSGSISTLAQALLTFGVFSLLACWATGSGFRPHEIVEGRLRIVFACWALAVLFAFFQTIPLPPTMVAILSPSVNALHGWTFPEYPGDTSWHPLSTTPGATIQSGLLISACGTVFFLVTQLCRTRRHILTLALMSILIGVGEALYGLTQVGGSLTRAATGTFVNRNHFSALLAMALCISVGLLLSRWQGNEQGAAALETNRRLDRWVRSSPLIVATVATLAAIVFSFSRMGLMAPVSMLALYGLFWLCGPVSRRIRLLGMGIGAVIVLLMAGAWPALEVVAGRFQALEDSYRIAAWEGTYRLFQSSPIVGVGLGSLVDNLPRFLPAPIPDTFDHSHNELLEILAEGGVVYASLLGIGLLVYFGTLLPAWFMRRDSLARGLGLGCLAGATSVFLHSLVEFPLRMPANALYLSVIMGMGWVVIRQRPETNSQKPSGLIPSSTLFMRVIILMIAVGGMGLSAVSGVADFLDRVGDGFLARAKKTTGEAQQALLGQVTTVYQWAHQIEPWQPSHLYRLGRAYEISTASLPPLSDSMQVAWASATASYSQAVEIHPANSRMQAALAWAALQSGDLLKGRQAVQAALKLAPDDPEIRFAVSRWYLMQWENLSAEETRLATSLVQRGAHEFPERYVEAIWQFLQNPEQVRSMLPTDLLVRRLLLAKLTERQLFFDRWAEQEAYPVLRTSLPEKGIHVVAHGELRGRQEPPFSAARGGSWTGMVAGWLSGGLAAKTEINLPPGETVLYFSVFGESAGGVWPTVSATLGGYALPLPAITGPGWHTAYILLSTPGGRMPLGAVLTNGAVILENGQFIERRVQLGSVRILTPK